MTLRIAFIGCGWWTTFAHLPAALADPGVQVVGISDNDETRLATVVARFEVESSFADAREMLAAVECDIVVIASPNSTHFEYASLALEHGCHVLLEKPMVIDPVDGWKLVEIAERLALHLVVGYAIHYNAQVARLRDEIASGRLGELESVSSKYFSIVRELYRGNPRPYQEAHGYPVHAPAPATYTSNGSGGGQGQAQLTHAAALVFWTTGLRPVEVAAFTNNADVPVDLADAVVMRFDNGSVGTISTTGGVGPTHDEKIELSVFGREGHAFLDVLRGTCSIHDAAGVEMLPTLAPGLRNPERAPLNSLIDLARGCGINQSPPRNGAMTADFIAAMYRSAAERQVISLIKER